MPGILSEHINIGKELESKLIQVGIDSFEKLKSAGSETVESLEIMFKPDSQDMAKCYSMGQKIALRVKSI